MSKKYENQKIAKIINYLEKGRGHYDKERIEYLKEARTDKGTKIDGYIFNENTWCWIIAKPTDIGEEPGFKGEPLIKIVPRMYLFKNDVESIVKILEEEIWTYL